MEGVPPRESPRMFSSRLSLSTLIELCRTLRHYLGGGLSLPDAFRQQARRGPAALSAVATRLVARLEAGDSLADALATEADFYPPLFVSLASVGEQTGMLPEVFADLERHYVRQQALRRTFILASAWPIIQFVLATFVIALVFLVLGMLAQPGGPKFDPSGVGLLGPSGAAIFLACV